VQLGEVLSGGSYLSLHDLRIHFGLGAHERLDKAEVLWPDGQKETLINLAADRFYSVREGPSGGDSASSTDRDRGVLNGGSATRH